MWRECGIYAVNTRVSAIFDEGTNIGYIFLTKALTSPLGQAYNPPTSRRCYGSFWRACRPSLRAVKSAADSCRLQFAVAGEILDGSPRGNEVGLAGFGLFDK